MSQDGSTSAGVREGDILAGKYRVERVLGVGGMGVVVAAYHIQLETKVALKFLLPAMLANREAVNRFAREARAAVKITSEHVARVLDVGTLETGAPYMVMEYLEGGDLAAWLHQRGPLPVEQASEVCAPGVPLRSPRRTGSGSCTAISSPRTSPARSVARTLQLLDQGARLRDLQGDRPRERGAHWVGHEHRRHHGVAALHVLEQTVAEGRRRVHRHLGAGHRSLRAPDATGALRRGDVRRDRRQGRDAAHAVPAGLPPRCPGRSRGRDSQVPEARSSRAAAPRGVAELALVRRSRRSARGRRSRGSRASSRRRASRRAP